jgi:hypothetical protein
MSDRKVHTQLALDVTATPSLFDDADRALLADIASQQTDADRDALAELARWARS